MMCAFHGWDHVMVEVSYFNEITFTIYQFNAWFRKMQISYSNTSV